MSMHKKSEVDLRVAQELKNNKDFIYETNQSLQILKEGIVSLSIQQEKILAAMNMRVKKVEIAFENLEKRLIDICDKCDSKTGDSSTLVKKIKEDVNEINLNLSRQPKYNEITDVIDKQSRRLDLLEGFLQRKTDGLAQDISSIRSHFSENVRTIVKEMLPKPFNLTVVKNEIESHVNDFRVEFKGFFKEIELLKKAVAYGNKKFENIYTLIERLKAGTH